MSIADHFDDMADATLVRDYDRQSARRQFNISIVLIVTLTLAAAALSTVVRFEANTSAASSAEMASPPPFAGKL